MSLRIVKGDQSWLAVFNFGSDHLPVPTRQGDAPVLCHGWDGRRLSKWGAAVWEGVEDREDTACD